MERFNEFSSFSKKSCFGSLQTFLLCLVGELAGGGCVAMTVDISGIGSTNRKRQEIQCLPHSGFSALIRLRGLEGRLISILALGRSQRQTGKNILII